MGYDLETDLRPRIEGRERWGHVEEMDLMTAVSNLTMGGSEVFPAGVLAVGPYQSGQKAWARYRLTRAQGGAFTGEATAITYSGGGVYVEDPTLLRDPRWENAVVVPRRWVPAPPRAWTVAICKHELAGTSTQEESRRGMHRAHCTKCGMDLSVDSGD